MTDAVSKPPPTDLSIGTDRRRALHGRRYAAESRFKLLGLSAIFLSVGFLAFLLFTILAGGLPAFTYHYLNLNVDLSQVQEGDVKSADYDTLMKDGVYQAMPYLEGRKGRRLARSIVSGGAAIELRNEVLDNPDLAGSAQTLGVPVSDFADLYLKGLTAKSVRSNPDTLISVSDTTGSVSIEAGQDVFRGVLDRAKNALAEQAELVRLRMAALQRSLDNQLTIKANSPDPEAVTAASESAADLEQQIATVRAEFDRLIARKNAVNASEALDSSMPSLLLKLNGGTIKVTEVDANSAKGDVIIPLTAPSATAGNWTMQVIEQAESNRKFSDREVAVVDQLVADGGVESRWASIFFSKGASREPELAGIWGAVVGSFFTMLVTLLLSFPLGVAAAIYLEEFAPKNRLTAIIEVNINNLAAVPSIVFGLLGLAVFLNFFGMPRSAPLVGGMVLALMTLPTIIIASRAALKAVPPSIREAALGVGASKQQAVFHHVLPLAMPGMLTGTIIGMAQALGETAPLLMIGMVAFVVDIPGGFTDPATVLPVQIYMWADFPEPGFQQKTAAAIMVLLGFLVLMNAIAVLLRKRFERRW